ncbi:MAG: hypothetical protein ACLFQE_03610 [Thermotogota bacterium]
MSKILIGESYEYVNEEVVFDKLDQNYLAGLGRGLSGYSVIDAILNNTHLVRFKKTVKAFV